MILCRRFEGGGGYFHGGTISGEFPDGDIRNFEVQFFSMSRNVVVSFADAIGAI